ncbi:hypothetical protein D210916BOD24_21850 [Alteromonas sp. D210916BOD_24]|uniref:hypothetical protein n=1 Tax=Alteromonas sp. D210916BOD_24 TaxID=3157618 RepID=UPI00399C840E
MKIVRLVSIGVSVCLLACSSVEPVYIPSSTEIDVLEFQVDKSLPLVQQAYSIPDETSCLKNNGQWKRLGRQQRYACVLPASDAGAFCINNSDCEVGCVALSNDVESGTNATGVCLESTDVFGCRAYISKGVVEATLCVD